MRLNRAKQSVFAAALCESAGVSDLQCAIADHISGLFGDIGDEGRLRCISERLGVRKVYFDDMPYEGLLFPSSTDSSYEIAINQWAPKSRQRFTLAHELGHIVLHKLLPETRQYEQRTVLTPLGSEAEEIICDAIAAEILMPMSKARYAINDCDDALMATLKLASKFEVSISAAAFRVREVSSRFQDFAIAHVMETPMGGLSLSRILANFENEPLATRVNYVSNSREVVDQIASGSREVFLAWFDRGNNTRSCWYLLKNRTGDARDSWLAAVARSLDCLVSEVTKERSPHATC